MGELLERIFPMHKVYQEYPLDRILEVGCKDQGRRPDPFLLSRSRGLRADWVVLDLRLIVEYHGEHHYHPVSYGDGKAESRYQTRIHLDKIKRLIAKEANFYLMEWPFDKGLTEHSLHKRIFEVFKV
jgi:hypothetical protein